MDRKEAALHGAAFSRITGEELFMRLWARFMAELPIGGGGDQVPHPISRSDVWMCMYRTMEDAGYTYDEAEDAQASGGLMLFEGYEATWYRFMAGKPNQAPLDHVEGEEPVQVEEKRLRKLKEEAS